MISFSVLLVQLQQCLVQVGTCFSKKIMKVLTTFQSRHCPHLECDPSRCSFYHDCHPLVTGYRQKRHILSTDDNRSTVSRYSIVSDAPKIKSSIFGSNSFIPDSNSLHWIWKLSSVPFFALSATSSVN